MGSQRNSAARTYCGADIEFAWAENNQLERLRPLAANLVRRQVAVIAAAGGNNPSLVANEATTSHAGETPRSASNLLLPRRCSRGGL